MIDNASLENLARRIHASASLEDLNLIIEVTGGYTHFKKKLADLDMYIGQAAAVNIDGVYDTYLDVLADEVLMYHRYMKDTVNFAMRVMANFPDKSLLTDLHQAMQIGKTTTTQA